MPTITGTDGNDTLLGSSDADTFHPLLGADTVNGLGGFDTLVIDYRNAPYDPYAGAGVPGDMISTVTSNGGSFSGSVLGGGASVTFSNIERLQVSLNFWQDRFVIDSGAFALGATVWVDGGLGLDTLQIDFSALASIALQIDASGLTTSFGTFVNFERYAMSLTESADTVTAGTGNDAVYGRGGDDVLNGGGGNDVLHGGAGSNHLIGGEGDDQFLSTGIDVVEGGGGADRWSGDYGWLTAAFSFTRDRAAGTATLSVGTTLFGIEFLEALVTGSGNDVLVFNESEGMLIDAGAGLDSLTITGNGFSGDLRPDGPGAFRGSLGHDRFTGIEYLTFTSLGIADVISVDAAPLLTGATLHLDAAGGSDTLIIDLAAYGSISFIVAADGTLSHNVPATLLNFENFHIWASGNADTIVTGDGHDIVHGGAGDDVISTGAGNDQLEGGSGSDTLTGGTGDDLYLPVDADDAIVEHAGEGTDEVRTALASFSLAALPAVENLIGTSNGGQTLIGNARANRIGGGAGNDVLFGGGGNDILGGGFGDDIYIVAGLGAVVLENVQTGNDIVYATASYMLHANAYAEIETLAVHDENSTYAIDLVGNTVGQTLLGNAGANVLTGGWGADILDGKGGADTFRYVSNMDSSLESPDRILNFQTGIDKIDVSALSAIYLGLSQQTDPTDNSSYYLVSAANAFGYGVILRVYGTIALSDILTVAPNRYLVGTTADEDSLLGSDGHDILDGLAGADTMIGFGGNDSYYVDHVGDIVTEAHAQGTDTVYARIDYRLGAATYVEVLSAVDTGATTPLTLIGNELDQTLIGNAGANSLFGGDGNDRLIGGGGSDRLVGGFGVDHFRFEAVSDSRLSALRSDGKKYMPDVIVDFVQGTDKIDLGLIDAIAGTEVNNVFSFIGANAFTNQAGQVRAVTANGATSVYADVNGDGAADLHILLATPVTLTADDFIL